MLSRRREQIVVLFALIAVNLGLGWSMRRSWADYRARTQWIYGQGLPGEAPASNAPAVSTPPAQSFAEIVNRNLFRPERTNELATESAKMPDLPILYGTMNLGNGMFAVMAPGDKPAGVSRQVFPGQEVGGFKLVSVANSQVEVAWHDKKFTIDVWESSRRLPRVVDTTAASHPGTTTAPAPAPAAAPSRVTIVPPASSSANLEELRKKFTPAGFNAPAGAPLDAPDGFVLGGRRKHVEKTMMGDKVWWEDIEAGKNPAGKATEK